MELIKTPEEWKEHRDKMMECLIFFRGGIGCFEFSSACETQEQKDVIRDNIAAMVSTLDEKPEANFDYFEGQCYHKHMAEFKAVVKDRDGNNVFLLYRRPFLTEEDKAARLNEAIAEAAQFLSYFTISKC